MKRGALLLCACGVVATLALSSESRSQTLPRKDILIFELIPQIEQPTKLNWFVRGTGARREHGAHQVMWEPLFLLNYESGKLDGWLGESIEPTGTSKKFDTWTLKLRQGIEWSDHKQTPPSANRWFTSKDVEFTVNLVLRSEYLTALDAATVRSQVKSVAVPDERTVIFELRRSNPRFALEVFGGAMFGSFLIMPKHVWEKEIEEIKKKVEKMDDENRKEYPPERYPALVEFAHPIGTGPYVLKSIDKDRAVWVRNNNWWGIKPASGPFKARLPLPLQIEWRVVKDAAESKKLLQGNELDAAREYTRTDFKDVADQNRKIIGWDANSALAWNDPCPRQLEINVKYAWGDPGNETLTPWSEPKLRQALSLLLDRTRLSHVVYEDTALPSQTMFAEYGAMKPFIEAAKASAGYEISATGNPAKADARLSEAGYQKAADGVYKKGGEPLTARILANADLPQDVDAAKEIAKQMNEAGVKARVETIPNGDYWGRAVPKGEYEMVYGWLSCGSVAEPFTSMSRYLDEKSVAIGVRSPGYNNTGRWDTTQAAKSYSEIVKKIGDMAVGQGADLVKDAYQHLNAEMPFIPLVQSPRIIPFNTTYWKGWPVKGRSGVPMHNWGAAHQLIHALEKAN
jgi:peptide/nickel transport system substrate-binding protein